MKTLKKIIRCVQNSLMLIFPLFILFFWLKNWFLFIFILFKHWKLLPTTPNIDCFLYCNLEIGIKKCPQSNCFFSSIYSTFFFCYPWDSFMLLWSGAGRLLAWSKRDPPPNKKDQGKCVMSRIFQHPLLLTAPFLCKKKKKKTLQIEKNPVFHANCLFLKNFFCLTNVCCSIELQPQQSQM